MAFSKSGSQGAVSATKLLVTAMISAVLCFGLAVCARAQEARQNSSYESWTATTEGSTQNVTPWRRTESRTKSGNRTVDKLRVEVLGPDHQFRPDTDIETETVRLDNTTTHTAERTYKWDGNGRRTLAWITEAEARTPGSGDGQVVSTTWSSDVNGNLQTAKREVTDIRNASTETRETTTKVYLGDGNGGFTLAVQTQELQKQIDDRTIEVKKKTLLPDGNGNWKVDELTEHTIQANGRNQTTEERVSRPDGEGRLLEVSRTVGVETENTAGERTSVVDKYSRNVPGSTDDGSMHWTQRVTTAQSKTSGGRATEKQVEQPNPGNPSDGPQVTAKTRYTVQYSAFGSEEEKTTQVPDGNGTFNVFAIETRKSNQVRAPRPIAVSGKPGAGDSYYRR